MYAEFKRLLREGDRNDPATMVAIVEVSGFLAEAIPHLLNEIEALHHGTAAESPHPVKMDLGRAGIA